MKSIPYASSPVSMPMDVPTVLSSIGSKPLPLCTEVGGGIYTLKPPPAPVGVLPPSKVMSPSNAYDYTGQHFAACGNSSSLIPVHTHSMDSAVSPSRAHHSGSTLRHYTRQSCTSPVSSNGGATCSPGGLECDTPTSVDLDAEAYTADDAPLYLLESCQWEATPVVGIDIPGAEVQVGMPRARMDSVEYSGEHHSPSSGLDPSSDRDPDQDVVAGEQDVSATLQEIRAFRIALAAAASKSEPSTPQVDSTPSVWQVIPGKTSCNPSRSEGHHNRPGDNQGSSGG